MPRRLPSQLFEKPLRSKLASAKPTSAPPSLQRALARPLSASPEQLLQLQRQYGNRAAQSLIQRAQTQQLQHKAAIDPEGDEVEHTVSRDSQAQRGVIQRN